MSDLCVAFRTMANTMLPLRYDADMRTFNTVGVAFKDAGSDGYVPADVGPGLPVVEANLDAEGNLNGSFPVRRIYQTSKAGSQLIGAAGLIESEPHFFGFDVEQEDMTEAITLRTQFRWQYNDTVRTLRLFVRNEEFQRFQSERGGWVREGTMFQLRLAEDRESDSFKSWSNPLVVPLEIHNFGSSALDSALREGEMFATIAGSTSMGALMLFGQVANPKALAAAAVVTAASFAAGMISGYISHIDGYSVLCDASFVQDAAGEEKRELERVLRSRNIDNSKVETAAIIGGVVGAVVGGPGLAMPVAAAAALIANKIQDDEDARRKPDLVVRAPRMRPADQCELAPRRIFFGAIRAGGFPIPFESDSGVSFVAAGTDVGGRYENMLDNDSTTAVAAAEGKSMTDVLFCDNQTMHMMMTNAAHKAKDAETQACPVQGRNLEHAGHWQQWAQAQAQKGHTTQVFAETN